MSADAMKPGDWIARLAEPMQVAAKATFNDFAAAMVVLTELGFDKLEFELIAKVAAHVQRERHRGQP